MHLAGIILFISICILFLPGCGRTIRNAPEESWITVSTDPAKPQTEGGKITANSQSASNLASASSGFQISDIPVYSGTPYVAVHDNIPYFSEENFMVSSYEKYSELDSLGRCATAEACIGTDLMPTEERGEIWSVKPTGWHTSKYDFVDGESLYNRCHLIAYQLTGENDNPQNLITGTRYLNTQGMLPFENLVGDYIRETGNHVLYRVTPVFEGNNLLSKGVLMEAESVEDRGESILFCVFCYNVQPGITIDYETGDNYLSEGTDAVSGPEEDYSNFTYVLNINSRKVHLPGCESLDSIKDKNKQGSNASPSELLAWGYKPCGSCRPFSTPE